MGSYPITFRTRKSSSHALMILIRGESKLSPEQSIQLILIFYHTFLYRCFLAIIYTCHGHQIGRCCMGDHFSFLFLLYSRIFYIRFFTMRQHVSTASRMLMKKGLIVEATAAKIFAHSKYPSQAFCGAGFFQCLDQTIISLRMLKIKM